MKIAAIYARVSSAKQQLNENIASQIAALEQYAQQNEYHISPLAKQSSPIITLGLHRLNECSRK